MKQKGFAPILIILILAAVLLSGYFIYQKQSKPISQPQIISQSSLNPADETANPDSIWINWKTYRLPAYIGIKIKYPSDKLIGNITEYIKDTEDKPTQDENLVLWQSTIPLKDSNILITRKHNINPITNKPYNAIEEYDERTKNFSTIQVSNNDAKDSKEYLNKQNEYQRDVIFFRKNYIWTVQEISQKEAKERYLDRMLLTWTFFEYSPSETGVYKDVDR